MIDAWIRSWDRQYPRHGSLIDASTGVTYSIPYSRTFPAREGVGRLLILEVLTYILGSIARTQPF